jgi:hypothetical protein
MSKLLPVKYRLLSTDFKETSIFSTDFRKNSNVKFHQNPLSAIRVVPCGQTDMTKLIVAFRNFANVPKNVTALHYSDCSRQKVFVRLRKNSGIFLEDVAPACYCG